jgi:tRNA (guanine37-N1)-methyltransferase
MKISILTMFPELFDSFFKLPLVDRAVKKGIVTIDIIDIKPYAGGSFRHIDDSPCGGGVGMILRFDTIMKALEAVKKAEKSDSNRVILLSPKGQVYSQRKARELVAQENLVLICGHYEGVDRRVENHVDEMISIGDYILSGGETAAEVIVDSIVRLLDGVIRQGATKEESHENVLLEYPQYTKPVEYLGERVPDILLSGNHGAIDKWRHIEALKDTKRLRPDLFEKYPLSEEERKALDSER